MSSQLFVFENFVPVTFYQKLDRLYVDLTDDYFWPPKMGKMSQSDIYRRNF
jgi:hypothetical protein